MYMDYDALKSWAEKKKLQDRINKLAKKYKDKKILVYGAGILSSVIFDNYDLSGLNIIGVADQKFFGSDESFNGHKGISPYDIQEQKPEVILLAVYNTGNVKDFIHEEIFSEMGKVPVEPFVKKNLKEKIVEFLED